MASEKIPNTRACFCSHSSIQFGLPIVSDIRPHQPTHSLNLLPTNLPIVVDVFCRQPIRCPSPVGEFLVGSRRSSYNHRLELGIYINMIVRWFIHTSVISYMHKTAIQQNTKITIGVALGSTETVEHAASLRQELIRVRHEDVAGL